MPRRQRKPKAFLRERSPKMSARKPATRIVQVKVDTIQDLMSIALEDYFRAIKVLSPSDVVDDVRLIWDHVPWEELVDVQIKLIQTPQTRRSRKKEVEHIVYNGT